MNCYNMVLEYINKSEKGIPIFIEEIKEYIIRFYNENEKEKVFNNIKAILNRMNKEGIIETAYKGIYYIPNENIFGKMLLGNRQIIRYKYIMDKEGNIKGYITGAKLFNEAHLTTQVPNVIDIATNECKNFNKYENKNLNVIIRKPKIEINNENYKYLQLFDLIENKDNIGIEVDNPDEIIYNFIEENNLDFEKIIKYAHKKGAIVVLDASQSIPHTKIDVQALDADFVVFSGHKMLAPLGIGVLYGKRELLNKMSPFLMGGDMIEYVYEQETTYANKFEAGTQNVEGVVGLGAAIDYIENLGYDKIQEIEEEVVSYAREKLSKLDYLELYMTPNKENHSSVISFNIKGVHPHDVASILDSEGVCIRSRKSLCSASYEIFRN